MLKNTQILLLAGFALTLSSCDGIFSDIYDEPVDDSTFVEGFTTHSDSPGRYQLCLNATSYTQWHYINLDELTITTMDIPTELTGDWDGKSGWTYHYVQGDSYTQLSTLKTDPMPEPDEWDFAIHHFDVRTNGGAAKMTDYEGLMSLPGSSASFSDDGYVEDARSTTQCITDLSGMMAYNIGYQNISTNSVLSGWVTMDISNPPPVYSATNKVYLMRLANGYVAAIILDSYMSESGTKGYLTIDIKYPY